MGITSNTSTEIGYGLQNTLNCLVKTKNHTQGDAPATFNPLMWKGVSDFRSAHSNKWFVPSLNELIYYVYRYKSSLIFDGITGGSHNSSFWSSSESYATASFFLDFDSGEASSIQKDSSCAVRLCRAF